MHTFYIYFYIYSLFLRNRKLLVGGAVMLSFTVYLISLQLEVSQKETLKLLEVSQKETLKLVNDKWRKFKSELDEENRDFEKRVLDIHDRSGSLLGRELKMSMFQFQETYRHDLEENKVTLQEQLERFQANHKIQLNGIYGQIEDLRKELQKKQ